MGMLWATSSDMDVSMVPRSVMCLDSDSATFLNQCTIGTCGFFANNPHSRASVNNDCILDRSCMAMRMLMLLVGLE